MAKKNLFVTVLKCDLCDLKTKNHYIMKRHKMRCRRNFLGPDAANGADADKGNDTMEESFEVANENASGTEAMPTLTGPNGAPVNGTETGNGHLKEPEKTPAMEGLAETLSPERNSEKQSGPRLIGNKAKPAPKISRNYICDKCSFCSRKSRAFLYHLVEEHKSKLDIFACSQCDYCSQHKTKLQRHIRISHKINVEVDDLKAEYAFTRTVKSPTVRPVKKVKSTFITKNIPGKKLTVKFVKPATSSTTLPAPKHLSYLPSPSKSQSMEHLSKVVEEIPSQEGVPVYKCKECQFTSDDKQKVAKHAVSWHVDTKSFSCTYCDYITFDRTDFMAHRQVHRNEHQFRCDECTYSTDFRPNMDRHIMNHKNSFPFTCSFCTYGCGSEAAIRRHMVMNHDPVPTEEKKAKLPVPKPIEKGKLPVPKPVESLQKSLQSDIEKQPAEKETVAETGDHEAMESDTVDGNIDDMNENLSTEQTGLQDLIQTKFKGTVTQYVEKDNGKLLCPVCKLKYKRSSDLNRHMKRKHGCRLREYVEKHFNVTFPPIESVRPPRSTQHVPLSMVNSRGEVGFSTEYLDYGNDDFLDMDDTFDSFSKPLQPEEPVSDSPSGGDKPLDLTFHQSQEGEQAVPLERLKCPHCLYQAKWPSDYRRHIAVHSVERKYKCSYCPKKYKYIGDLNVHARKDHNKEPGPVKVVKVPTLPKKKMSPALFKCPCCNYTSCWKSEVDRHSRLHKDEKTFQCKKCDYQSYWRGDMRRHMYKHHPDVMTEGVAINDVIIVHKDHPKIVPGKVQDQETAKSVTSLPNSESLPYTEALSNIVTGSNLGTVREEAEPQAILPLPKEIGPFATISAEPQNLPLLSPIYQGLSPTKPTLPFTGGSQEAPAVQAPPPASKSPTPSPIKDLGGGMYECNYCGFTANAPSKMNMHIATHTNLKRYKCTICGRRANWKWDISKHIKRDHNDFETQVIKLSKQEAEETIQEYMEGYPTVRRDHHLNVTPDRIIPHLDGVKFFKCSVCDFSAEKKLSVSRHISYMHSGVTARIVVIKKMPNDGSPQITPTKKGTQITPSKISPQITPSKISPQITPVKISPQITQSTPLENLDKGYTASPIVTPVLYEPLQTSGSQIPLTGSQLQTTGYQLPATEDMDIDKPFMCSDCGKRGVTKGDVKKHYHYVHPNQEIRIVYLGDGSQSVYAAKSEIGQYTPEKNGASPAGINSSSELASSSETASGSPANNSMDSSTNVSTGSSRSQSGTLPHPKVLGYIRPYKCSICGRRSNWKWDLNNHIRDKHRGEDVKVITLNENEAKATLDHYMNVELPVLLGTAIKGEGETVALPPPSKDTFRQLKCSSCSYRSNCKADVKRHIVRKHVGSKARIIVLDTETARRTLTGYDHDRFTSKQLIQDSAQTIQVPGSEYTMLNEPVEPQATALLGTSADVVSGHETDKHKQLTKVSGQLPKTAWDGLEKKYWKCSVCSYASEDKVEALKHMGKHNMKAYKCTGCDYISNFRSGVYRHIKFKHGGDSKDMPVCKLTIKLIKEGPGLDSSGNQIMPEGAQEGAQMSPKQLSPSMPHQTPSPQKELDSSVICEKYYCKKCMFQSKWRSCVCRHLRDKHKIIEYTENIMKRVIDVTGHSTSPQKVSNQAMMSPPTRMPPLITEPKKALGGAKVEFSAKPRNFVCSICPYRTYKSKMLKFHNSCHKPQPGVKQVKCKYCPYYVSGARLLSQHMQLHIKHPEGPAIHPGTPEKASPQKVPSSPEVPKRHGCELCPYTTNSKNDFLYHKQFHRPKPTADFKCEHCEYWVTHKRLLKQHMKVHSGEESGSPNVSAVSTPTKSDYSENALIYDTVEIAAIKQRIIASKITPSISMTPMVSPMKLASNCSMGNKRGFMKKDGTYRKVHKCRFCPYMNLRLRNLRLHELMHGRRSATNTLMKCPHCNYYVGSKGLLAHHLKVHQPDYGMDFLPSTDDSSDKRSEASEDSEMEQPIPIQNKVDTLFEIARFKKYGCEKCPYASAKRAHFQRHVELHGSKQKCKCSFCDYSVPSMNLLAQHTKLHFEPNQNLLAAQSILNLQHLPEMPADVALASMMANVDSKHPVSVTHDHLELYENAPEDCEPKKIYRCDRCPYANIRRDHLLAHLRCHMTKNEYVCPYCDYSVGKTHVLMQHVKVHFSPLPELSDWLIQSGDTERIKQTKEKDLKEAIELATLFQTERKKETQETDEKETDKSIKESENETKESQSSDKTDLAMADTDVKADTKQESEKADEDKKAQAVSDPENSKMETNEESFATVEVDHEISFKVAEKTVTKDSKDGEEKVKEVDSKSEETGNKKEGDSEKSDEQKDPAIMKEGEKMDTSEDAAKETKGADGEVKPAESYICQYCDREFKLSDALVRHEMQHLIGNSYEELMEQVKSSPHLSMAEASTENKDGEKETKMEVDQTEDGDDDDQVMSVPVFGERSPKKC